MCVCVCVQRGLCEWHASGAHGGGLPYSGQLCAGINIISTRFSSKSARGYRETNRSLSKSPYDICKKILIRLTLFPARSKHSVNITARYGGTVSEPMQLSPLRQDDVSPADQHARNGRESPRNEISITWHRTLLEEGCNREVSLARAFVRVSASFDAAGTWRARVGGWVHGPSRGRRAGA